MIHDLHMDMVYLHFVSIKPESMDILSFCWMRSAVSHPERCNLLKSRCRPHSSHFNNPHHAHTSSCLHTHPVVRPRGRRVPIPLHKFHICDVVLARQLIDPRPRRHKLKLLASIHNVRHHRNRHIRRRSMGALSRLHRRREGVPGRVDADRDIGLETDCTH